MRESIGTVSLLNFVIFFILLIFAFLMGTFSYYKAFRVNNAMVSAIEKYEGVNDLSVKEIDEKLTTLGYQIIDFDCPITKNGNYKLVNNKGVMIDNASQRGYSGYCIYVKDRDVLDEYANNDLDRYDSYDVTTIISIQFPVLQNVLKMRVSAKTNRIYNFECAAGKCD